MMQNSNGFERAFRENRAKLSKLVCGAWDLRLGIGNGMPSGIFPLSTYHFPLSTSLDHMGGRMRALFLVALGATNGRQPVERVLRPTCAALQYVRVDHRR